MQRPIVGQLSIAVAIISLYWLQITVNFVPFYNGGITRLFVCLFVFCYVCSDVCILQPLQHYGNGYIVLKILV